MIPKIIHYIWLSNDEMPESITKCIDSWKKQAPTFEIKHWSLKDFNLAEMPLYVKQAIESKKWAFASDYLRAYVLYQEGGVYLDSDVFMLKDIETYLNHSFVSAVEYFEELFTEDVQKLIDENGDTEAKQIDGLAINAAMMASVSNHPYLKDVLDYYRNLTFEKYDEDVVSKTLAPHIYSYVARKHGFKYLNKQQLLDNDMYLYPNDVFAPAFNQLDSNSILVHLCAASWREQKGKEFYNFSINNIVNYLEDRDFSRPYLSIVVLCYKVAEYLPQCLESIRRQTFKDFEVIMVDDGSPDACGVICNAYAKMDSRFKVIHKQNGGIIAARKDALNMARGIWAGSVDGDDWISLDMYKDMWLAQCAYDVDIVQTKFLLHYTKHSENLIKSNVKDRYIFYPENIYKEILKNDEYFENHIIEVSLCRSIVRTDFLKEIMNKLEDDCSLCEDAVCMYVCAAYAKSLCIVNREHYHYRVRNNSCTTSIKSRDVNKLYKLLDIARKELKDKELGDRILKQLEMYFIQHCLTSFLMNSHDKEAITEEFTSYIKDKRFQDLLAKFTKKEISNHFSETQASFLYLEKGYEKQLEKYKNSENSPERFK